MIDENIDKRLNIMKDGEIIKRLLKYAKPFSLRFVFVFLLMIVQVGMALLEPFLLGSSIDVISEKGFEFSELTNYLTLFLTVIVLGAIFNYYQTIILQITGQDVIFNIRKDIFTHLEYHDIDYLNKRPTGSLVTRVTNDTNTLNEMYTSVIVNVFKNLLMVIGIVIAMFLLNVKITLMILIVVPFIIIFSFVFRRYSRKAYRKVRGNLSRVNAFLAEHLSGMKIIQIFTCAKSKS